MRRIGVKSRLSVRRGGIFCNKVIFCTSCTHRQKVAWVVLTPTICICIVSCSDPHKYKAQPYHYFCAVNAMLEKFLGIWGLVAKLKCVHRALCLQQDHSFTVILNLEPAPTPRYASVSATIRDGGTCVALLCFQFFRWSIACKWKKHYCLGLKYIHWQE